jgi:hypothetical protein
VPGTATRLSKSAATSSQSRRPRPCRPRT